MAHYDADGAGAIHTIRIAAVGSGTPGLSVLLDSARKKRFAIRAVGAPFEFKDDLLKRGYRWDPGDPSREKAWWTMVEDEKAELSWLQKNIYERDVQLPTKAVQPNERFSKRIFFITQ